MAHGAAGRIARTSLFRRRHPPNRVPARASDQWSMAARIRCKKVTRAIARNVRVAGSRDARRTSRGRLGCDAFQGKIDRSGERLSIVVELFDLIIADAQKIRRAAAGLWLQYIYAR